MVDERHRRRSREYSGVSDLRYDRWTVPSDWTNTNTIEGLGEGGNGDSANGRSRRPAGPRRWGRRRRLRQDQQFFHVRRLEHQRDDWSGAALGSTNTVFDSTSSLGGGGRCQRLGFEWRGAGGGGTANVGTGTANGGAGGAGGANGTDAPGSPTDANGGGGGGGGAAGPNGGAGQAGYQGWNGGNDTGSSGTITPTQPEAEEEGKTETSRYTGALTGPTIRALRMVTATPA